MDLIPMWDLTPQRSCIHTERESQVSSSVSLALPDAGTGINAAEIRSMAVMMNALFTIFL